MRYSNIGMWGRANYFAKKASYSHNYRFKLADKSSQMFVASVLIGTPVILQAD